MSVMHCVHCRSVLKDSFFYFQEEKCFGGAIIILLRFRAAVRIHIRGERLGSDQNSFFF